MISYEHRIQTTELKTRGAPGDDPADLLSWKGCALGEQGWRLVSVVVDPVRSRLIGFFERPVPAAADDDADDDADDADMLG